MTAPGPRRCATGSGTPTSPQPCSTTAFLQRPHRPHLPHLLPEAGARAEEVELPEPITTITPKGAYKFPTQAVLPQPARHTHGEECLQHRPSSRTCTVPAKTFHSVLPVPFRTFAQRVFRSTSLLPRLRRANSRATTPSPSPVSTIASLQVHRFLRPSRNCVSALYFSSNRLPGQSIASCSAATACLAG